MDGPYLDPSRGRRDKAGVFVRSARLLGVVMFVTGVILGCYVGLHWLQTGRVEATLIEDVVVAKLPDDIRSWVAYPRSWYGLHRFVMWVLRIPLFASVAFSGFLACSQLQLAPEIGPHKSETSSFQLNFYPGVGRIFFWLKSLIKQTHVLSEFRDVPQTIEYERLKAPSSQQVASGAEIAVLGPGWQLLPILYSAQIRF